MILMPLAWVSDNFRTIKTLVDARGIERGWELGCAGGKLQEIGTTDLDRRIILMQGDKLIEDPAVKYFLAVVPNRIQDEALRNQLRAVTFVEPTAWGRVLDYPAPEDKSIAGYLRTFRCMWTTSSQLGMEIYGERS